MTGVIAGLIGSVKAAVASVLNKYWFYRFSLPTGSSSLIYYDSCSDASKNIYVISEDYTTPGGLTTQASYVAAYKQDGTLIWSKKYFFGSSTQTSGTQLNPKKIATDGAYLYALLVNSQDPMQVIILKLNLTDGSIIFAKQAALGINYNSIVCLPNGNLAVYGYGGSKGFTSYLSVRSSVDFSQIWTRYHGDVIQYAEITTDSSSNVYLSAKQTIQKYSADGTFLSGVRPSLPGGLEGSTPSLIDSAGNIWNVGRGDSGGKFTILKYNSSLVYQSNYTFSISGATVAFFYLSFVKDSDGNMYFTGRTSDNLLSAYLIKISPTGTIIWSNKITWNITGYTSLVTIYRLTIDSNNDLFMFGNIQVTGGAYNSGVFVKVRSDGTIAGTFSQGTNVTVTYAAVTVNTSSYTYTQNAFTQYFTNTTTIASSTLTSIGSENYTPVLAGSYLN